MGKRIIFRKILILSALIIISSIFSVCYSIHTINNPKDYDSTNKARILLNNCIYEAENGNYDIINNYKFHIYNLNGTIIKSNDGDYDEGSSYDLKTLSSTDISKTNNMVTYSAPFLQDNKMSGIIAVKIDYSDFNNTDIFYYFPLGISLLIIFIAIFILIKTIRNDILAPIDEIHNSTLEISKGNLNQRIYYDYDGEIGGLCHDFEALRLNLDFMTKNEKKLKDKEKLLLAYISHDLRTPIAAISGYVEGINKGIVKDEKDVKEYTDIILKKTSMLNNLIEDILNQSKAQLNEFPVILEECYSKEFFLPLIEEFKKDILNNNLNFKCSEIPNVLINIDKQRIMQVMQNLVSNAIKFTSSNPKGKIEINFSKYKDNLLISVRDNGIGIASSDLPMIFHEFYRGEKARTLNVPGSGLGLSISKYIVEKHKGRIECDSVLNCGTDITFSLPF